MVEDKLFDYEFKSNDYLVFLNVDESDRLSLELTDKSNGDKWKGSYESNYIEDLTRKTGNFKQFAIFIHMLETALGKTSESVTIDLYTYADLEQLRNKKSTNNSNASLASKSSGSAITNNKRYFILTYNVEFDRIHYPLQLNYLGKVDISSLDHTKKQTQLITTQTTTQPDVHKQLLRLQRENDALKKEKDKVEQELIECKSELKSTNTNETMLKEIKILKQMIKSLEEESLKEKNVFQKQLQKKSKECIHLQEAFEELRASERNLKHQVKSLQSELALHRRNRVFDSTLTRNHHQQSRDSSRDSRSSNFRSNSRDSFKQQQQKQQQQPTSLSLRQRSISREKQLLSQVADGLRKTRSRSNSYENGGVRLRSKNPSPTNSIRSQGSNHSASSLTRTRRFNPTEYVKEKNRKSEENELRKKRHAIKTISATGKPNRTPSISSITSALESDNDSTYSSCIDRNRSGSARNRRQFAQKAYDFDSVASTPNVKKVNNRLNKVLNDDNDTNEYYASSSLPFSSRTNDADCNIENDRYSRENEIKEIDARLKSLQLFMKNNMP